MRRQRTTISLGPGDRVRLEKLVQGRNTLHKHVWRAQIVLLSADCVSTNEIARRTGKSRDCVVRWRNRFAEEGYDGLLRDGTRRPRRDKVAERAEADPFDQAIATQLKLARIGECLSQVALAKRLGIGWLRVHRHETAKSRIGAAELFRVAEALRLPVEFFFYGVPGPAAAGSDGETKIEGPNLTGLIWRRTFDKYLDVISRIPDSSVQRAERQLRTALQRFRNTQAKQGSDGTANLSQPKRSRRT